MLAQKNQVLLLFVAAAYTERMVKRALLISAHQYFPRALRKAAMWSINLFLPCASSHEEHRHQVARCGLRKAPKAATLSTSARFCFLSGASPSAGAQRRAYPSTIQAA